ncbi:MAG: DUF4282 domain-containing protein [Candidatus Bipolaricaulaceae bacterium]
MGDYLRFRKMITPAVIHVVFWGGVLLVVLAGLNLIISIPSPDVLPSALLLLIFGPIAVRIICEFILVFFRMFDLLQKIAEKLERKT